MTKTFMQAPFLRLTVYFTLGIFLQTCLDFGDLWIFSATLSLPLMVMGFVPSVYKNYARRWFFGFGVFLLCVSAAGFSTRQAWKKSVWQGEAGERTIRALVLDDAVKKPKTLLFRIESDKMQALIYLPTDAAAMSVKAGDSIIICGKFEPSTWAYHRNHAIAATAFIRKWQKTDCGKRPFSIRFTALDCRRILLARLRNLIPDEREYSVAAAIAFGYKAALDKDLRQTFANTGSAHILAVSGLHFSIIYGMLYFLFSFLGNGKRGNIARQAIILPIMWFFAFLTGMSASVVRAATMLSIFGVGNVFGFRVFSLNTVGAAAFFMLLVNPLNLFDVGFQLSFAAVVAILLIYPRMVALYESKNPLLNYAWQLSCVSTAAQIGTAPLCIYYFHNFPVLFLITNLIAIPTTGLLLCLIPASLALNFLFGNIEWLMLPLNKTLHFFIAVLEFLEF